MLPALHHDHDWKLQLVLQGPRLDLPSLIFMAPGIVLTIRLAGRLGR